MKTMRHPKRRHESGTVLVELAFALPILLMTLFCLFEFARLNMLSNTAANAAYEGAREAALPGATATTASNAAKQVLAAIAVTNSTVTVTPATISSSTTKVTVDVEINVGSNSWFKWFSTTGQKVTRSCSLNREIAE